MFWFENKFCFKNEYIRFFLGTLVGKRKLTIFKKRWFDITNCYPLMIGSHLLHIQLFGSFLERVSNQTTAEMGQAGGVITSLYRAADPKHDELSFLVLSRDL